MVNETSVGLHQKNVSRVSKNAAISIVVAFTAGRFKHDQMMKCLYTVNELLILVWNSRDWQAWMTSTSSKTMSVIDQRNSETLVFGLMPLRQI
jgi:hypothetical protein